MKKFIVSALAAGALAAGGAASAQDFGSVIGSLLNLAIPGFTQQHGTVYTDQFGRQFYYDQYGRQVYLQTQQPLYGYNQGSVIGYDSWGRPIYSGSSAHPNQYSWVGTPSDVDGDGVANWNDRWPNDPRYR